VAVTGASGYLGRIVITRLASDPAVQSILGLDVRPPAYACEKFTFRAADVRTVDFVPDFQGLDVVYHLAFVVQPSRRLSMAEILGQCVTRLHDIFKRIDPDIEVIIWSDMLDPVHNAHNNY